MSLCCLALTQHLLLFLLVYADSAYSEIHCHITPSLNVPCPQDPCLIISQFSADSTTYLSNETNISLSFLPGNHSLDRELSLSRADKFFMTKDMGGNGTVFVECVSQLGRFNISETTFATIQSLHFIGCGGNRVSQVEQLIVEDTIFQGVKGRGTALVLNEVTATSIAKSSFLFNTHCSTFKHHDRSLYTSYQDRFNYLYLNRNSSLSLGGALYIVFSNVTIVSSNFTHNTAEIGGALLAHSSGLHVFGSTCSNNRASFGGVMITSESSVNLDNNKFTENAAKVSGGVMITYRDSFSVSGTTFTNNSADVGNGVMETYGSSFTIRDSIFSDNTVEESCGVIYATDGFFHIRRSSFIYNSATNAGVMFTRDSSFNIDSSTFTNNQVKSSGVIVTVDSSFSISSSNFTNNSATNGGVIFTRASSFNIAKSTFTNNSAANYGGVLYHMDSVLFKLNISNTIFANNSAIIAGRVIWCVSGVYNTQLNIDSSQFYSNKADGFGGIFSPLDAQHRLLIVHLIII